MLGPALEQLWHNVYSGLNTIQFIYVDIYWGTVSGLQNYISGWSPYATITYPIMLGKSDEPQHGGWNKYIDIYEPNGQEAWTGIAIITPDRKFNAIISHGSPPNKNALIDWTQQKLDDLQNPTPAQPIDVVLALDRSGSMGGLPPGGGSQSKFEILKDAVELFLDVWEANAVTGDRAGIFEYSHFMTQGYVSGTANLVPIISNVPNLITYVDSLTTGGCTCIGGALVTGMNKLSQSVRSQMILFTDGMQNFNPFVIQDSHNNVQIKYVSPSEVSNYDWVEIVAGDSGIPPLQGEPAINLTDFNTRIHTIGVGVSSSTPWFDLLAWIAIKTHGLYHETTDPYNDLQFFYLNTLMQLFRTSPQYARRTLGTYNQTDCYKQDSCSVNSTARRLTVALTWQGDPDQNHLLCTLQAPDGTVIDLEGRIRTTARRHVISMPLPTYNRGRLVNHIGTWQLRIMGTTKQPVPYQTHWIIDDNHIHLNIVPINEVYRTGDVGCIKFDLVQDGKFLSAENIRDAIVFVTSPAVDADKFIKNYRINSDKLTPLKKDIEKLDLASEDGLKLHYMTQYDKDALRRMSNRHLKQVRIDYGEGHFEAKVRFEKPGVHQLNIRLTALDLSGKPFDREAVRCILVR